MYLSGIYLTFTIAMLTKGQPKKGENINVTIFEQI